MVIRNVAWDHSGASIADKKQTGNTSYSIIIVVMSLQSAIVLPENSF